MWVSSNMRRVAEELESYYGGYLSVVSYEPPAFRVRLTEAEVTSRLKSSSLFRGNWERTKGKKVVISIPGYPVVGLNIGESGES